MRGRILLIVHRATSNPGRIGRLVAEFGGPMSENNLFEHWLGVASPSRRLEAAD